MLWFLFLPISKSKCFNFNWGLSTHVDQILDFDVDRPCLARCYSDCRHLLIFWYLLGNDLQFLSLLSEEQTWRVGALSPHTFLSSLPAPSIVLLSALLEQRGIDNCNRIAKSSRKPAVSISPPIILFRFFLWKIYMKGEVGLTWQI